ncbi:response regulator [Marinifilum fragile]|uniref:response regulator n=1 Tax=Marinifilum fragile TaxID=570161 RepID=UPI0009FA191C
MAKASPHILVVDDDVVVLKFIEYTLKGLSYKTTLAKNGIEAIDKAKTEHFDLIISDLYMPLMDGNDWYVILGTLPNINTLLLSFYLATTKKKPG